MGERRGGGAEGERRRGGLRRYRFAEGPAALALRVPEVLDSQYGTHVWPCAVVLAQYLWAHRRNLPGKRVLEVGAGTGLPGLVAAKCGAAVTLSDSEERPRCLWNCRRSCQLNGLPHLPVLGLTWGRAAPQLLSLPPVDIILGSDVFFDPKGASDKSSQPENNPRTANLLLTGKLLQAQFHEPLRLSLVTVSCNCCTSYKLGLHTLTLVFPPLSADWSIEALLCKWKLKSIRIPLHSFGADKEHLASSSLPGRHTIEMMIISLARSDGT